MSTVQKTEFNEKVLQWRSASVVLYHLSLCLNIILHAILSGAPYILGKYSLFIRLAVQIRRTV